jgi:hypothetical protein
MRLVMGVMAAAVLTSCSEAGAGQLDSRNPAHCIAAFNYQIFLWKKVGNHPEQVREALVRSMFEDGKWKASNRSSSERRAEVSAATRAYANKPQAMNALASACLTAEEADPDFHLQRPQIIAFMRANPPPL